MKGFTRYYRDPAFRAELDEQLEFAREATAPSLWTTYAIHDPTEPDDIDGRPEGPIVYVGQSKQFAVRVRDRLSAAGRAVRRPTDNIDGLLYDIMSRGPCPRWSILEHVGTAIDSFVSETNWITRLRSRGYRLVNQWAEHRLGTAEIDRYGVPSKRLWPITAGDAIGSGISVILHDPTSGADIPVDLATIRPSTRLQNLRIQAKAAGCRARLIVR